MAEFKLPDPKKNAGRVLGVGLLAGIGFLAYAYLLPFLLTVVWGTVSLGIAALCIGVLGFILFSPKFWKRLGIILETFGEILFKGFVEMNPFTIMQMQIDRSKQDREDLKIQAEKLKGQEDRLKTSLLDEQRSLNLSAEKIELVKKRISNNPNDMEAPMELESATNDWTNSKDYIEKVSPICNDITKLVSFVDRAYIKSGYALKDAEKTIQTQRRTYEAVTTGSNAMKKALRAFTGDPEMNKAGTIALEALRKDISQKIGTIKNSIQLTNQIMNEKDLNDAAKVSLAVKQAEQLNMDSSLQVTNIQGPSRISDTPLQKSNKYLKDLN
jgi:hypothetical protein